MTYGMMFLSIFVCLVLRLPRYTTANKEKNEGYDEFLHIYRISSLQLQST